MTALLEMKQKLKNYYGQYELYILPVLKFLLALGYFVWINQNLGFSKAFGSIFIVLIMALLCSILPTNCIVLFGFILIIGQCYALSVEVACFAVLLIVMMLILLLRFSPSTNVLLAFVPLGFFAQIPMAVPVGAGLLVSPLSAAPAAGGVILTYFIRMVNEQASVLSSKDTEMVQKLQVMLDGIMKNQEMWICVAAFVIVILLVYLLRTRSMDYAWRVAIIAGVITYASVMLAGGLFLEVKLSMVALVISSLVTVAAGFVLEFIAFGGDYSRTERLEFEDDDYYYYVKAVPKTSISTSERQIKKINGEAEKEMEKEQKETAESENKNEEADLPAFTAEEAAKPVEEAPSAAEVIPPESDVDFESKLEESLKDL